MWRVLCDVCLERVTDAVRAAFNSLAPQSSAPYTRPSFTFPPCLPTHQNTQPQVDVWLGDGTDAAKVSEAAATLGGRIDFLFLDGTPKESLTYLQAALPFLAPGALVVADNCGVFAQGGLKSYLEFVRQEGGSFESASVSSHLEWREEVPDAMEVSVFKGKAGEAALLAAAAGSGGAGEGEGSQYAAAPDAAAGASSRS